MTRFRRLRWIAITAAAATVAGAVAIGAEAFADRGVAQCSTPASAAATHGRSWRTAGFRAVGCHAWRHMHHSHVRSARSGH
jgi:hypothetical protein